MSEGAVENYQESYEAVFDAIRMVRRHATGHLAQAQFAQNLNVGSLATSIGVSAGRVQPQGGLTVPLQEDMERVAGIVWQLVGQGILVPWRVSDLQNTFVKPTAYGTQIFLSEDESGPYDPEGFLANLTREAPLLEPESLSILTEAVRCYASRLLRSSAVMMGVASEIEIEKLIAMLPSRLENVHRDEFERTIASARSISARFRCLLDALTAIRRDLPIELQEVDVWLGPIFNLIRVYRNEAGHPHGVTASRPEIYANLTIFRRYARNISKLKEHFS